jgi:hypothetical protein
MPLKRLLLSLLILIPLWASARQQEYMLEGFAHMNGGEGTLRYKLVITINGTSVKGSSVTWMTDGSEMHAVVHGQINTLKHTLNFAETSMHSTNHPMEAGEIDCLFDAKLTYQLKGDMYQFKGPFTSKDSTGRTCGMGSMVLASPNSRRNPFEPEVHKTIPNDTVKKAMPVATEALPKEQVNKITGGEQQHYEWHSDTCSVDVWDGGVIDGDAVTIVFNGKTILDNYTLAAEKKHIALPLTKESNTIEIIAENQGATPPNTARITLWDGAMHYAILSYLEMGSHAVIIITKK